MSATPSAKAAREHTLKAPAPDEPSVLIADVPGALELILEQLTAQSLVPPMKSQGGVE